MPSAINIVDKILRIKYYGYNKTGKVEETLPAIDYETNYPTGAKPTRNAPVPRPPGPIIILHLVKIKILKYKRRVI